MQLITYFAPEGGAGRKTAMMATASGLVSAGHSVVVLDLHALHRQPNYGVLS